MPASRIRNRLWRSIFQRCIDYGYVTFGRAPFGIVVTLVSHMRISIHPEFEDAVGILDCRTMLLVGFFIVSGNGMLQLCVDGFRASLDNARGFLGK